MKRFTLILTAPVRAFFVLVAVVVIFLVAIFGGYFPTHVFLWKELWDIVWNGFVGSRFFREDVAEVVKREKRNN